MSRRAIALICVFLVILAGIPFAVHPTGGDRPVAVPFEQTNPVGISEAVVQQSQSSNLVIPKAEAYYSQYRYVVGYYGITSLTASLQMDQQRTFGQLLTVYVSDFSGTNVSLTEQGYLRTSGGQTTGWVSAQSAYFVVNSRARVPTREATIVPFSDRADARAFARRYGGEVHRWQRVQQISTGRLGRSAREWRRIVDQRRLRANRSLATTRSLLNRPVSTVVGQDAPTITAAVERAPSNTTVVVPPGTYNASGIRIRKPITIRGAGPNATRIIGDGNKTVISVSAPSVGITDLSISGVGPNRSGANQSVENIPIRKGAWNYQLWKVHGYGDAAITFDSAPRSLVSDITINTTSNGIIARNSANLTVTRTTIYGTKRWQDGFIGVTVLGAPAIIQNSSIYGGKVGVYAHDTSGITVRGTTMEGMMVGVFDLYASQLLIANNSIEDTWNAIYVETRTYGTAVVDNQLHNSRNGAIVSGQANYVANNVMLHNKNGFFAKGEYTLYRRNIAAFNQLGVRGQALLPTNRVTSNDFIRNRKYARTMQYNTLHVWSGNYWSAVPGLDRDGDGTIDRTFRPTGPVDGRVNSADGAPTLAHSPAVYMLRRLQQLIPGLRGAGIIDPQPRTRSVQPTVVDRIDSTYDRTGRHDDPDTWDFQGHSTVRFP